MKTKGIAMRNVPRCAEGSLRVLLILLVALGTGGGQNLPAESAPEVAGSSSRVDQTQQAKEWVKTLAGDAFLGRGTGNGGTAKARDYLVAQLTAMGLPGAFDGGYTQAFPASRSMKVRRKEVRVQDRDGRTLYRFDDADDFTVLGCSRSGKVAGDVVFAGYATRYHKEGFDSFAGADKGACKGKIVLAFRYEPHDKRGVSLWTGKAGRWSQASGIAEKIAWARKHEAAGLIIINPPLHARARLLGPEVSVGPREAGMPVLMAGPAFLQNVAARSQLEGAQVLDKLKKRSDAGKNSLVALEGVGLEIDLQLQADGIESWNVGARLAGAGSLAHEAVLIGAHYDHLGTRGSGPKRQVFHGADDNASGTAAVLLLARRISKRYASAAAPANRRAILFVLFGAEEVGLVGSRHLAGHLEDVSLAPADIQAMINLDMVGRLKAGKLNLIRAGSNDWEALIGQAAKASPLDVTHVGSRFSGSDHASFLRKKIPSMMVFTGSHRDYHRPSDTWDKIDYPGLVRIVGLVEEIALAAAVKPDRLGYDASTIAGRRSGAYLGITCDESFKKGCKIRSVVDGAPAAKAGLRSGDVIVGWNKREVDSAAELIGLVGDQKPGREVTLVVLRGDARQSLKVKLGRR
jgi:hypothetical protein